MLAVSSFFAFRAHSTDSSTSVLSPCSVKLESLDLPTRRPQRPPRTCRLVLSKSSQRLLTPRQVRGIGASMPGEGCISSRQRSLCFCTLHCRPKSAQPRTPRFRVQVFERKATMMTPVVVVEEVCSTTTITATTTTNTHIPLPSRRRRLLLLTTYYYYYYYFYFYFYYHDDDDYYYYCY